MYHTIIVVGSLGRDPEMRFGGTGEPITNFSVAVNTFQGGAKATLWVRVSVFGKQAESCATYLKKGSKCLCEGVLNFDTKTGGPRVWQGKNGHGASFEIKAHTVRFLSSPKEDGAGSEPAPTEVVDTGEVPF